MVLHHSRQILGSFGATRCSCAAASRRIDFQSHGYNRATGSVAAAASTFDLGRRLPVLPEVQIVFGEIPVAPYGTPATEESAASISKLIKNHDIVVLDHHGAISAGSTLRDAYCRMEKLGHMAKTLFIARQLGELKPLSDDALEKIAEFRKKYFAP